MAYLQIVDHAKNEQQEMLAEVAMIFDLFCGWSDIMDKIYNDIHIQYKGLQVELYRHTHEVTKCLKPFSSYKKKLLSISCNTSQLQL